MIFHQPVLLKETIGFLEVKPGQIFIDATVGGGGHAQEIIKLGGLVIGIDQDPEALAWAQDQLRSACPAPLLTKKRGAIGQAKGFDRQPYQLIEGNFANLGKIIEELKLPQVSGVLFDLGTSYHQLTENRRGFSFESDYLDMRMSPKLGVSATELIAALSENELYQLFTKLSQEKHARAIAGAIIRARKIAPITSGKKLAELIEKTIGPKRDYTHPATKVFQALRIAVNDELDNLRRGLEEAKDSLTAGGRLVVISFHEGEDRIVKNFFRDQSQKEELAIITKKPVVPKEEEIKNNPRSRSAKLRAASKT